VDALISSVTFSVSAIFLFSATKCSKPSPATIEAKKTKTMAAQRKTTITGVRAKQAKDKSQGPN